MRKISDRDCLWYREEAKFFEEALPLGNGKIGAMIYGGAKCCRIGLNHDELWTGVPSDGLNGVKKDAFYEMRNLALENKFIEANKLCVEKFCQCARVSAYMPLGNFVIESSFNNVTDYRRALFLRDAVTEEEFVADGSSVSRECFISYPNNCLVWHNVTEKPIDMTISMGSPLESVVTFEDDVLTLEGVAPIASSAQLERDALDEGVKDKHGMRFCARMKIISNGKVMYGNGKVTVSDSTDVTLLLVAETSFNGFDKHPISEGKNEKKLTLNYLEEILNYDYSELLSFHLNDVNEYYDKVYFSLDGEESGLPLDERLKRFDGGRGAKDNNLYVLLFNYGRYLTIAGSRKGSRPLNLQGIWNDKVDPPWSSNYTTNINLQMNYFPTLQIGLADMLEPLEKHISNIAVKGRKTAQELYGARGFVCHHNSDIWASTVPVKGDPVYSFWPYGSGWLLRHLYEHYRFTNDIVYLKSIYPLLEAGASFYLDLLCDVDGYRMPCPSTSPENSFIISGERCSVSKTTTMSVSIIRELFENCLEAAEALSICSDITEEIKKELPKLMPINILPDGRIEEWYFGANCEYTEYERTHRHVSHLYALYPAHSIDDKKTLDAVRKSLDARGDESTGWSLAWRICLFAALKDGERALSFINRLLTLVDPTKNCTSDIYTKNCTSGVYKNLFGSHPPFQIDANFGYVAGICEMLLQNDGKEIIPLPAIPKDWKSGEIRGLRTYNKKVVDIVWKNGKIIEFKVKDAL